MRNYGIQQPVRRYLRSRSVPLAAWPSENFMLGVLYAYIAMIVIFGLAIA